MDPKNCSAAHKIVTHPVFMTVTFPQLISPFVALLAMVWFSLKFFRRGDFHKNAKILLACQLFFSSIYCISFILVDSLLLFNILFRQYNHCFFLFYAKDCVAIFYSITVSVTGMAATQVCIGIERIVSTIYVKNYEKFSIRLGIGLAALVFLLSIITALIVLSSYDPYEERGSCLGVPATAGHKSRLLYYVIITCDAATVILFLYTWKLNSKVGIDQNHLALGIKYQRNENANVIKMLLPNVVAHGIVYGSFSIAATILRDNEKNIHNDLVYQVVAVFINFVPHYTVVEIVVLHWIMHRTLKRSQDYRQQVSMQSRESEKDVRITAMSSRDEEDRKREQELREELAREQEIARQLEAEQRRLEAETRAEERRLAREKREEDRRLASEEERVKRDRAREEERERREEESRRREEERKRSQEEN